VSKGGEKMNKQLLSRGITSLIVLLATFNTINAAVIFESATMGQSGQYSSDIGVDQFFFLGSRFYVPATTQITAIGGHLGSFNYEDIFGAIVRLNSSTDLPKGFPLNDSEIVAHTQFTPNYPSSDFRAPLSCTLSPGYYGLVFGSGKYSATGTAYMPNEGQSDLPGASYFFWDGLYEFAWFSAVPFQGRFVVEGTIVTPEYCSASGGCNEFISRVTIGTIDNTSTTCTGYSNYTAISTIIQINQTLPITVTAGNSDSLDQCRVWIDWNHDMDFDDVNETINMNGSPGSGPYTATITPPAAAVSGDTRMRIRLVHNQTPLPCGTSTYGEVEDYNITIKSYCQASAECDEYISRVIVGSIDNYTECSTDGYANYTSLSTTMEPETNYSIVVTNGEPYEGDKCGIWIDWNQDLDFDDAGEMITVIDDPEGIVFTATITPPATATPGNTRMRVRIVYNETPLSCGELDWGETEDYTINIESPQITVHIDLSSLWMYQNLPGQNKSRITADAVITSDPLANSSYYYYWVIQFPPDVNMMPSTVSGGSFTDTNWTFAAPGCNYSGGISDSGQTFKVKVVVEGIQHGNTGYAEREFAIALLGDVDNNKKVDVADRAIINAFWLTGAAGPFTLKDCDLNCNNNVSTDDRAIANAIWLGAIGRNSVSVKCPLR
jgi:hypothetical protein